MRVRVVVLVAVPTRPTRAVRRHQQYRVWVLGTKKVYKIRKNPYGVPWGSATSGWLTAFVPDRARLRCEVHPYP
jgi:hypothetical protein